MKLMAIAAMLLLSPDAPSATFDAAMSGFTVGIEDDAGPDGLLSSTTTEGCSTRFTGRIFDDNGEYKGPEKQWAIDWTSVDSVGMGDPSFFAVKTKDGKIFAFITDVDDEDQDKVLDNLESISMAAEAALYLHISCDPDAKARYEAMGMKFPVRDQDGNWEKRGL